MQNIFLVRYSGSPASALNPLDPYFLRCVYAASEQLRQTADVRAERSRVFDKVREQLVGLNARKLPERLLSMYLGPGGCYFQAFKSFPIRQYPLYSCCGQYPAVRLRIAFCLAVLSFIPARSAFDKVSEFRLSGGYERHSDRLLVWQVRIFRPGKRIGKKIVRLDRNVLGVHAVDCPVQQIERVGNEVPVWRLCWHGRRNE